MEHADDISKLPGWICMISLAPLGAILEEWWEQSFSTIVVEAMGEFSTQVQEVFPQVLWFYPLTKNQTLKVNAV